MIRSMHNKRVALVLGSGGARGYAHIGVIEELEARGYEIVGISGCSMGALIGGLYAAGKLSDYKEWVINLNYFDLFRLVDVTWSPMGAIKGEKVMDVIASMLNGRTIESLPIPFTSVATDLINQKEVWFQEGSLEQAIRASVAVPGVITPVQHRGRTLVDGGLLNPLPITPAVAWHADLIIAVNVTAQTPSSTLDELMPDWSNKNKKDTEPTAVGEWMHRIKGKAGDLLGRLNFWEGEENEPIGQGEGTDTNWGKLNIIIQSFETTQAALAQYKIAGYPPDILIEVPRSACSSYEFHRASQLIELGRRLTKKQLNEWEQLNPFLSGDLDG
ncbi:patatin-like phospholipase family protein [Marinospirillum sp.]|uniref:patatin-like phospholipase family protein n=1 Tax=Marinospirillum sp. TaxID=2183934 RepID=UPI002B49ABD8|nr:patatin-like phospholipase family protein [Marinospirillum sp.]